MKGYQDMGEDNIYFYAILNKEIGSLEKRRENTKDGLAIVKVKDGGEGPVEMKIGISFVSVENAKQNVEQEIGDKSFNTVRKEASQVWENLLSKIEVKGGTHKQKQLFYTSLYRSFLWPALRSDVNGEYTDVKGNVVKAGFNYYTVPSLCFSPADDKYIVTVLIFAEVRWRLDNGKELVIRKPDTGRAMSGITVDGKVHSGYFVSHDLFRNGGEVKIMTKEKL